MPCLACPQLLANATILLCGNVTGAFHKHQMQDASRDLFTYTVKCIQIRKKLRIEKRQQVRTLLLWIHARPCQVFLPRPQTSTLRTTPSFSSLLDSRRLLSSWSTQPA